MEKENNIKYNISDLDVENCHNFITINYGTSGIAKVLMNAIKRIENGKAERADIQMVNDITAYEWR